MIIPCCSKSMKNHRTILYDSKPVQIPRHTNQNSFAQNSSYPIEHHISPFVRLLRMTILIRDVMRVY